MRFQPRATRLFGESAFEVLSRARELEAAGRSIVHLEIGQPDFPTPPHIVDAAIRALRDGRTGYGPAGGLPELRRAVAEDASKARSIAVDPSDVVITTGAKPILFYAINALAGPGDEVIYPDPGFPMYGSIVAHSGARAVPLRLREERDFRFDPDEFLELAGERTRLVILNSPHNPTGGVLSREDLEVVAEAAQRYDFHVLTDEVYRHFAYDEPFASIASLPGMRERTIIVDGFSKAYSMTGWRVGYGIFPPGTASVFEVYNVNIVSCAPTFNQWGALEALRGPQDCVREMVATFRTRRDRLLSRLNGIGGLRCVRPAGAFYAFPNVKDTGLPSKELAREILEEAGVAVLAGDSFGEGGAGYLRLSYAQSLDAIEEAVERIGSFLAGRRPPSE